jgi:hypothetical protein
VFGALCGLGCDRGVLFWSYLSLLCRSSFSLLSLLKTISRSLLTRTPASNWIPWYVDLQNTIKVQCLVCGEDFTKKHSRMLSHLGYIPSTGARDNNVKLCKNLKPDVLHAFCECGGVAPALPKPAESQHLQGSAESEESICQGSQSFTMYASCGASQNLAVACGPVRNSSSNAS